ncbi:MAG: DNA replication and repair protein RecF, partial [Deltaproteobacteria bacterium]|nr:DNA replication and repair protein RecF [Nannocystaceae bacterium]
LDRQRGTTSVGPHRDDVRVQLERRPVAEFASQGQTRAIVLALKLAELELVDNSGTRPLLLLDDVSSELDPERSDQLFSRLGELAGQCVLTTTATHFVRLPAAAASRWVAVERGELRERGPGP